jgi:hypothetical protein
MSIVSGASSIEYFVARKDPFRQAPSNEIPVPYPFDNHPASQEVHDIVESKRRSYEKVLEEFSITLRQVSVQTLNRRGFPSKKKNMLIILTRDENTGYWEQAATVIQGVIENAAGPAGLKIGVEIRNQEKMYFDASSIIRPDTAIHRALMQVQPIVSAQVEKSCPGYWKTIEYHMRGPRLRASDRKPTVIITVKPGTRHLWQTVESQIEEAIKSVNLDLEINLEIMPGLFLPSASLSEDEGPRAYRDLPEIAVNGSSIGPRGDGLTAGSLGVWLYFQPYGETEKKKCFLTCHHVIPSGDPAHRSSNDVQGIGLDGRKVEHRIKVDYPAAYDTAKTRSMWMPKIANDDKHSAVGRNTIQTINRYASAGGIGGVEYSSGFRKNNKNTRLDWALVVLNSSASFSQNKPPPETAFLPEALFDKTFEYVVEPNEIVSNYAPLVTGDWVAKTGRTTTVTAGEVSSIKTEVWWENGMKSMESVVLTAIGGHQFAKGGDSGAMVINLKKEWVGIVIGSDAYFETGYVTPVQDLMDDIKEKTGGIISLA